ncbi:MAG: WecB/TagA/CpsF family glycosyltransferase, partial [Ignavibacteriaceae bacterium]
KNVENKFPGIKIAGAFSPPFRDFLIGENDRFIKNINYSEPDIIWVSLGAPKQEKWIYSNFRKLNKGLMIGIGAGFDYLAENLKNAPEWMKELSLEWTYRLIQDPGRLWKRYLISNSKFIFYATLELLGLKKFRQGELLNLKDL